MTRKVYTVHLGNKSWYVVAYSEADAREQFFDTYLTITEEPLD